MTENEIADCPVPPSKRAARRIIQRALVLTGRDRQFRQHIREVHLITLWTLEDWDLTWTVIVERGKIEFERRPSKHPDLTLNWPAAEEFFECARTPSPSYDHLELGNEPGARRIAGNLLRTFFRFLGQVLRNPVDDAGESLLAGETE